MHISVSRLIDAPLESVFRSVADVSELSSSRPHIVKVEILGDTTEGVGTRFRETRQMRGKPVETELEVTEFVLNEHVRIVADDPGTTWDTVFSVRPEGDAVRLQMVMDARPKRLAAKIINSLIKGMVRTAVERDMEMIKTYCERQAAN